MGNTISIIDKNKVFVLFDGELYIYLPPDNVVAL